MTVLLTVLTVLRTIVSIILMLFALCIVIMNWGCFIASERNRRRRIKEYHSTVPLASLICFILAHMIYPFTLKGWIERWIGIIILVDIGNWMLIWMLVIRLPWAIAKTLKKRPPNQSL